METYLLLFPAHAARGIIDDWLANDTACDLRFRRARTKGHIVIETTDPLFAARLQGWHSFISVAIRQG